MLLIGTESHLSAYDINNNSDLFFKESDGITAIIIGKFSSFKDSIVIVGGNCSILGYDMQGNEVFWTVTGDNVTAMALIDIDNDGEYELIVGSEDSVIRIFKNVEVISEITEADKVTHVCHVYSTKYAYALSNGTVGVYTGLKSRLWRVKTKTIPTSILACDINNDGNIRLISGWLNSTYNIRNTDNGELLYRGTADTSITQLIYYDYKLDNRPQLLVCTQSGRIIGYQCNDIETALATLTIGGSSSTNTNNTNTSNSKSKDNAQLLIELHTQKQDLLIQYKQLEKSIIQAKKGEISPGNLSTLFLDALHAAYYMYCFICRVYDFVYIQIVIYYS